ncbi:uncharacterized protein V6R79_011385 [Siganus canaliculatus]
MARTREEKDRKREGEEKEQGDGVSRDQNVNMTLDGEKNTEEGTDQWERRQGKHSARQEKEEEEEIRRRRREEQEEKQMETNQKQREGTKKNERVERNQKQPDILPYISSSAARIMKRSSGSKPCRLLTRARHSVMMQIDLLIQYLLSGSDVIWSQANTYDTNAFISKSEQFFTSTDRAVQMNPRAGFMSSGVGLNHKNIRWFLQSLYKRLMKFIFSRIKITKHISPLDLPHSSGSTCQALTGHTGTPASLVECFSVPLSTFHMLHRFPPGLLQSHG